MERHFIVVIWVMINSKFDTACNRLFALLLLSVSRFHSLSPLCFARYYNVLIGKRVNVTFWQRKSVANVLLGVVEVDVTYTKCPCLDITVIIIIIIIIIIINIVVIIYFFFFFFWRPKFFYGDHFTIEGRQKVTFWKSELGALVLCHNKQQQQYFIIWQ